MILIIKFSFNQVENNNSGSFIKIRIIYTYINASSRIQMAKIGIKRI